MIKLKSLLSENILTEAFKDKNGYVWPHFKDQKSVDAILSINTYTPTTAQLPPDMYKTIFGDVNNADTKIGADGNPDFFLWYYWNCQALNPNRSGFSLYTSLADANKAILAPGQRITLEYSSKYYPEIHNYVLDAYNTQKNNIEWWDKPRATKYPKNDPNAVGVSRWQLFSQYYIKPYLSKMNSLWVNTPAKPATPGMQPGTAKAPIKS